MLHIIQCTLGIINILGGIASFLGAEADWAGAILGLPLNPLLSPLLLPAIFSL